MNVEAVTAEFDGIRPYVDPRADWRFLRLQAVCEAAFDVADHAQRVLDALLPPEPDNLKMRERVGRYGA